MIAPTAATAPSGNFCENDTKQKARRQKTPKVGTSFSSSADGLGANGRGSAGNLLLRATFTHLAMSRFAGRAEGLRGAGFTRGGCADAGGLYCGGGTLTSAC